MKNQEDYKIACHKILDKVWGTKTYQRSKAYRWLAREMGRVIHFSEIHNLEELKLIHSKLVVKQIQKDNVGVLQKIYRTNEEFTRNFIPIKKKNKRNKRGRW